MSPSGNRSKSRAARQASERREDGGGGVPIADDEVPRAALRGRNLGLEIRERQDRVQEQDAIDPPAPEDGA